MKLIIAIIQPEELPEIKEELLKNKIYKFTVSNALGQGKEVPITEVYRGIAHEISLLKKVRLEIAVNDEYVDKVICIDDCCPLNTGREIEKKVTSENFYLIRHKKNLT